MANVPFVFVVLATMCSVLSSGCPGLPGRKAKPYVKSSAVNGGPEDEAIREIEAAGGTCYRYQELKGLLVQKDRFWLQAVEDNPVVCVEADDCNTPPRLLMGAAQLKDLQSLCIRRSPLDDEDAALISEMDSIRSLRLENTNITATGISDLAELKLEHLNFDSNKTNDKGVKAISTIGTLTELHLNGSLATDAGFAQLADLKELRILSIGSSRLSDTGLRAWSGMKALEELSINGANISGVGFDQFDDSRIRILKLNRCKISPAGLRSISRLSEVEQLSFFGGSLTDAGLESLAEMPMLQSLSLYGNPVTEAGLRKLSPSKSLRQIDVTQSKVSHAECQRFNQDSAHCRAMIIED